MTTLDHIEPSIPDNLIFSFASQACQFPAYGPQGLQTLTVRENGHPIHCALYRDAQGRLVGILYHYPVDIDPWEKAGNVNIYVHPDHQREGIGTSLAKRASDRWGPFDFGQQRYTAAGLALARKLAEA